MTKPIISYRGRRKKPSKRERKDFQQIHKRQFPRSNERDAYQGTRGIQNIKQSE